MPSPLVMVQQHTKAQGKTAVVVSRICCHVEHDWLARVETFSDELDIADRGTGCFGAVVSMLLTMFEN